jgi:hypothetical protein
MSRGIRVLFVGLTVCALALTASLASAQQRKGGRPGGGAPGGAPGGGGGMMSSTFLLRSDAVQAELKLTDDQKAKLQEARGSVGDARDPAKMAEVQKTIQGILTPDQAARLKGISLQIMGVRAMLGAEVAQELGLSDDQKSKLQDIAQKSMGQRGGAGGAAPDQEARAKARQQAEEEAAAVLTADQKAKLEKMKGAKVNIDMRALFGGGAGGAGGGRRPGGKN